MTPFSQRKPLQTLPVGSPGAKNGQQEKAFGNGLRGLSCSVSEMPTMTPLLLLTGQATALLVSGPPREPRSIGIGPLIHNAARETASPCRLAWPATQPRLLMLLAPAPPPRPCKMVTS